jgi:hypothetical protein
MTHLAINVPDLPVPRTAPPQTRFGRWFFRGGDLRATAHVHTHPWHHVLWLTGVDYFSTLGYQPGIALLAAGALSPVATLILVAMTLAGALPTYAQVAKRSHAGQGSIAMLENLLGGWSGKIFVLVLLGFAGTDFVITMTLSAADAAQHAIENPYLRPWIGDARIGITFALLTVLAVVFLKGFTEAIGLARAIAAPYLALNLLVILRAAIETVRHPEVWSHWRLDLHTHGDWMGIIVVSALVFPKLALGMSGFETGVAVMPLVKGDDPAEAGSGTSPTGRIRATRKLLATAALIMSAMLILSSMVTTLLVPESAYRIGGPASGRALAYLAHSLLGNVFGTIYDMATIAILWFAGASAMAGLLSLIPKYLPRFGMAPRWVSFRRPLVILLWAIALAVTLVFRASVEAQGAAYATGVLVLMLSAAVAVALGFWRESRWNFLQSFYFWMISGVFVFTLVDNIIERPDGVIIASVFIAAIMIASGVSRYRRSTELRVADITFEDDVSAEVWTTILGKKVHLVPLRTNTLRARERKAVDLHNHYSVRGPLAFMHVTLADNRSEFLSSLRLRLFREGPNVVIEAGGAIAIANTIAYISELIDPLSIFLGLTRQNMMTQALRYFLWGEGETGLMVYTILVRYWEWTPEDDVRPLIFLMSE